MATEREELKELRARAERAEAQAKKWMDRCAHQDALRLQVRDARAALEAVTAERDELKGQLDVVSQQGWASVETLQEELVAMTAERDILRGTLHELQRRFYCPKDVSHDIAVCGMCAEAELQAVKAQLAEHDDRNTDDT